MAPDRIITVGSTGGKLQAVSLRECASNAGGHAIVANGLAAKLAGPLLSPFRLARLPTMDPGSIARVIALALGQFVQARRHWRRPRRRWRGG